MLIKEYRIPLPLTVEEYRIAQLYMIAKKSRKESSGHGSGVEIIINEPYDDGPGGQGQYTRKIYHVGSHLPGWLKGLLPKTALMVEEEAWNAYPYTKTRYTCPFVEKFSLEIETYYYADNGHQENVFQLGGSDLRNRIVDVIDVVKDQLYGTDYERDEDPMHFISEKTGRGPLADNWLEEYWRVVQSKCQPTPDGKALMCAYKLCRVEFRYWGMQTKLERFIHDVALRKTMLRAHRQAWAWQDEWHGLTMENIREIERQTQLALKRKMGQSGAADDAVHDDEELMDADRDVPEEEEEDDDDEDEDGDKDNEAAAADGSTPGTLATNAEKQGHSAGASSMSIHVPKPLQHTRPLHSPTSSSIKSFDLQAANWRIESLGRDTDSGSEDEFFDCLGESSCLAKWSSLDLLTEEEGDTNSPTVVVDLPSDDSIFSPTYLQRVASERSGNKRMLLRGKMSSLDAGYPESPTASPAHDVCNTTVLILVFHAGCVLDAHVDFTAKMSDVTTFRGAFESVMRQHYPALVGHISIKLVSCPSVCGESLGVLSSLSPYSFDVSPSPSCSEGSPQITHDSIPIGAIPLLASANIDYADGVTKTINAANTVYHEFLKSDEGQAFSGQVCIVGDSVGSILAYDALCRSNKYHSRHGSENSILEPAAGGGQRIDDVAVPAQTAQTAVTVAINETGHLVAPSPLPRRRSSSVSDQPNQIKFDFDVSDLFTFGSPLALVLAHRKFSSSDDRSVISRPSCVQVYNLFHPTDPVASRLEPLLSARFSMLAPVNIARYVKYPLGNGQPYHLLEILQSNPQIFSSDVSATRRLSEVSIQSTASGIIESFPLQAISALQHKWWGGKRIDYALYCPEGLSSFPTHALPHLFHASYWESCDVIAFILRQVGRLDTLPSSGDVDRDSVFHPGQPREKWIKKRTSVKLKNVAANHRANDVIVCDGMQQTLVARFMYGPLDMITLAGEKIDVHVMRDVPVGEWTHISTEVTDRAGRVTYTLPDEKALGYGLHPIKMVVRGDHTSVDFFIAVVPPHTECVVFSIDGSFTASMSVTGRDPKVRAGAVDIVRHWQELGYLIIYTTGRPDMQHQRVVAWLAQHNFPHGLVSFQDGLTTDPLGHKAAYLNNLVQNHSIVIHAAYGSSKDISVYTSVGLRPKQIFIVGKVAKKQHAAATVLSEGYAAHLASLLAHGGSRPAQGNARMVLPRGYFGLPGQPFARRRSTRSAKRTASFPNPSMPADGGCNLLERSLSTRRYQLPPAFSTMSNQ